LRLNVAICLPSKTREPISDEYAAYQRKELEEGRPRLEDPKRGKNSTRCRSPDYKKNSQTQKKRSRAIPVLLLGLQVDDRRRERYGG